ncbi:MAG: glycoside-pentoside-hexuronide (GPH):cation symporter [Treponema sp.]|nr:glycoside-pentoside-hexuronide (GPH):cation symporter [Treponema sp.]MCL2271536.1 glycoside-pentoside-hexuronide (GPH):cation symporter [Treponema sp.]
MQNNTKNNRFTFGLGTIGRDMVYAIVSMFLIFYLTDVINLPTATMWWVAGIILIARIFDAMTDPLMGFIIDNTNTRWGKFKPWITVGIISSPLFTILLFTDFGLHGSAYIVSFAVFYFMWGISYTTHDISYWSMLPALTVDPKEREKIGSLARICANIGLFFVVVGIVPITKILGDRFGSLQSGYFVFTIMISIIMVLGLCITLFGVKETGIVTAKKQGTPIRELLGIIIKNDQLFFTAIALSLFMIGYITTTSFGLYYFKYAYGDEGMFSVFSAILGVSQLSGLALFPLFSKKFDRRTLFTGAVFSMVSGYIIFFFAPVSTMLFIAIAGVLIFFGQSFIQLLMTMFVADTVDYGHWKLGKRNDSITFSLQPLIYKLGGAIGTGVVSAVIIASGIKDAQTAADVSSEGLLMMKIAMFIFPMLCFVASYFIYRAKYKIDSKFYAQILSDLRERGELAGSE